MNKTRVSTTKYSGSHFKICKLDDRSSINSKTQININILTKQIYIVPRAIGLLCQPASACD